MEEYPLQNIYEILRADYFSAIENTEYVFVWQTDVSMKQPYKWSRYYKMEIDEALFFSSRMEEARRRVDETMLTLWQNATSGIGQNQSLDIDNYIKAMTEIVNVIHEAVQGIYECKICDDDVLESENTNFHERREEKERFVLCKYTIASLVWLFMELQERYKPFIKENVKQFNLREVFTKHVGRWPYKNMFVISRTSKERSEIPDNCCFKYESQSNEDVVTLYETLIAHNVIDENTDPKFVIDLFGGSGCLDTIQWTGSYAILQAIIKAWIQTGTITTYPNGIGHWQVVSKRFLDKYGNPMKTLGSEASIGENSKKVKIVEDIVKALRYNKRRT